MDTGASGTCVDPWVISALEIPPIGKAWMLSASTGSKAELRNSYDVSLWLPLEESELHPVAHTMNIIECSLRSYGFDGLLGRDILGKCNLEYQGPEKRIKLTM